MSDPALSRNGSWPLGRPSIILPHNFVLSSNLITWLIYTLCACTGAVHHNVNCDNYSHCWNTVTEMTPKRTMTLDHILLFLVNSLLYCPFSTAPAVPPVIVAALLCTFLL